MLPDENKKFERHYLNSINELCQYKEQLTEIVKKVFVKTHIMEELLWGFLVQRKCVVYAEGNCRS